MLEMHYDGSLSGVSLTLHPNLVEAATLTGKADALLAAKRKLEKDIDDWAVIRTGAGYRRLSSSDRDRLEAKAAGLASSLGSWTNQVMQGAAQDVFRQDAAVTNTTVRAFQGLADAMATLVTTARTRIRRANAAAQPPPQTTLPPSEGGPSSPPVVDVPEEGMSTGAKVGIGLFILAVVGYGAYKATEEDPALAGAYYGSKSRKKGRPRRVSQMEGLRIDGKLKGGCRYVKGGSIVCR